MIPKRNPYSQRIRIVSIACETKLKNKEWNKKIKRKGGKANRKRGNKYRLVQERTDDQRGSFGFFEETSETWRFLWFFIRIWFHQSQKFLLMSNHRFASPFSVRGEKNPQKHNIRMLSISVSVWRLIVAQLRMNVWGFFSPCSAIAVTTTCQPFKAKLNKTNRNCLHKVPKPNLNSCQKKPKPPLPGKEMMGSPGSQASAIATSVGIRSGRRGQAGGSLLLRLLAVTFVLAACHAPLLTNAKVSSTHLLGYVVL